MMKKKVVGALLTGAVVAGGTAAMCFEKGRNLFSRVYGAKRTELDDGCFVANYDEMLSIKSHDGLELLGYYVKKPNPDFTMVIIHGYHSNAYLMSDYASAFYDNFNCDIFLPDLRGHGQSEGDYVGYGYQDKEDIKQWIQLLNKKTPDRKIVIFGLSMGGATVNFLSCEEMENVKVLIEDCGYSSLYDELDFSCKQEKKVPLLPFFHGLNYEVKKHIGYDMRDAQPIDCVKKAIYPMVFIHGLNDETVPSKMVFDLYNACPTEKQVLFVKDCKHARALRDSRTTYLATIQEFLEENL